MSAISASRVRKRPLLRGDLDGWSESADGAPLLTQRSLLTWRASDNSAGWSVVAVERVHDLRGSCGFSLDKCDGLPAPWNVNIYSLILVSLVNVWIGGISGPAIDGGLGRRCRIRPRLSTGYSPCNL